MHSKILKLSNVSKNYTQGNQKRIVLDNTCLEIQKGEIIAIIGRSGSGKSTLLNMMSGLDMPDSGDIQISGQIINRLDEYSRTCFRRKYMGFIFQFFNLVPTLTICENIYLPLELNNCLDSENIDLVNELLDKVQLSDRKDDYPDQLSGGEQQRIAILRAIVHKPALIFADEPTGNLDTETGQSVMALLKSIVEQFKATLVLVTHSEDARQIANRTFRMQNGKLTQLVHHEV